MKQRYRPEHTVVNSLLRIEGTHGDAPLPFERPSGTSDFWILELPIGQMLPAWQKQVLSIFQQHARVLRKCRKAGARCFLHVQTESPVAMLPAVFGPTLLNTLSLIECTLEHSVDIEPEQKNQSRTRPRSVRR